MPSSPEKAAVYRVGKRIARRVRVAIGLPAKPARPVSISRNLKNRATRAVYRSIRGSAGKFSSGTSALKGSAARALAFQKKLNRYNPVARVSKRFGHGNVALYGAGFATTAAGAFVQTRYGRSPSAYRVGGYMRSAGKGMRRSAVAQGLGNLIFGPPGSQTGEKKHASGWAKWRAKHKFEVTTFKGKAHSMAVTRGSKRSG